MFQKDS